ncbi:hypothetical protein LTR85_006930 [Meristemomyces frigidus]|nr:hypothetical protein LTR85_006930 [Meristemomyces frigidus]
MADRAAVKWLQVWLTTPFAHLDPARPRSIRSLQHVVPNFTAVHYTQVLTFAFNHIRTLHTRILNLCGQLSPDEWEAAGLLLPDIDAIMAWIETVARPPLSWQTAEEWRRSVVDAALHIEFAGDVVGMLERAVESQRVAEQEGG